MLVISVFYQASTRIPKKLNCLAELLALLISRETHVLRKNTRVNYPVMIDGKHIEGVEEFIYLGTKVTTTGDCDQHLD